jgi:NADH:ubiquinone oxidoreductase subunit 6 (subunit J)
MSIEWFRDLIIVIYGFLGIIVLIFIVILVILVYKKTRVVLNSIQNTADDVKQVVDTIKTEFVDPLVQIMAVVQGVKQGLSVISKLFRKD